MSGRIIFHTKSPPDASVTLENCARVSAYVYRCRVCQAWVRESDEHRTPILLIEKGLAQPRVSEKKILHRCGQDAFEGICDLIGVETVPA